MQIFLTKSIKEQAIFGKGYLIVYFLCIYKQSFGTSEKSKKGEIIKWHKKM
jgi:hypothetical protein